MEVLKWHESAGAAKLKKGWMGNGAGPRDNEEEAGGGEEMCSAVASFTVLSKLVSKSTSVSESTSK